MINLSFGFGCVVVETADDQRRSRQSNNLHTFGSGEEARGDGNVGGEAAAVAAAAMAAASSVRSGASIVASNNTLPSSPSCDEGVGSAAASFCSRARISALNIHTRKRTRSIRERGS
jgi:hypothetical protein